MRSFRFFLLLFVFVISLVANAQQTEQLNSNEKILFNAKIFTANINQPYAEAIAIRGGKIIAVGDFATAKASLSPKAELIDMHGQTVLPGFIDSHSHVLEGGQSLLSANVFDSALTVSRLADYAAEVKKNGKGMIGDFLFIKGINISTWSHIPELKQVFNGNDYRAQPVVLNGSDGHTKWVNNLVLQKAGINKTFIDQLDNSTKKYFGVDADGTPNGFVADSGFDKLTPIYPKEKTDWIKAGEKAMEYNGSLGITAFLDPWAGDITDKENTNLDTYQSLSNQHKLTAHVAAVVGADANADPVKQIDRLKVLQKKYNGTYNLSVNGFKIFADGVIEYPTQTASISKPYINSGSKGALMFDPEKFKRFVTMVDKANLLVHVHAIGDLAVTETLNGFEAARKANGDKLIPHTITHLQIVQPTDFARFAQLNVLASYQLLWAFGDVTTVDIVKPYLDPALYQWQYPARSMLQAGTVICGASDWPVSSANPFLAIYHAETRFGPKGVLDSTQCMPRMAMLYAYTINAAKALQLQKKIGSLEPGKSADMILADRDVLTISAEACRDTQILWTMFEGKIVYKQ
ncbi:MAG TPA: amidohydrolase [Panacibacter sp.]|nr:amidohydrolase [Panacibacter sp.]